MKEASLVLVGTGIKFMSHITVETKTYIEQSDLVLYLVNEPATKEWIRRTNPCSRSLDDLYTRYLSRSEAYQAITDYILEMVRTKQHVCVVMYGHPTVYADPGLNAVRQAKKEGFYTKILPGISAEACLFSDLLINPGSHGCQSFEATDFLIHQRKFDPTSHLILWQVDIIGIIDNPETINNQRGLSLLLNYLSSYYPLEHKATLYEASQYPGFAARIEHFQLRKLIKINFTSLSSLYIKPLGVNRCDNKIINALSINEPI